jgi:hypothetical protein
MSNIRGHTYGKRNDDGSELHVWGGIVSARVSDIAEALGATPEELLEALGESAVEPLTDTAEPKGRRGAEEDRPTDPSLRSVALTTGELETLRDELEARG